jgi:hypothetical protein
VNFNSIASDYKVVAFLETFPMINCKTIYLKNEMTVTIKRFETNVSLRNLGLSLKKVHCSLEKLIFLQGTIMLSRRSLSCHGE